MVLLHWLAGPPRLKADIGTYLQPHTQSARRPLKLVGLQCSALTVNQSIGAPVEKLTDCFGPNNLWCGRHRALIERLPCPPFSIVWLHTTCKKSRICVASSARRRWVHMHTTDGLDFFLIKRRSRIFNRFIRILDF